MPNWCENYVEISGQKKQIKRLIETKFDFNNIVPEPKWNEGDDSWYDWRCENWGCKWNRDPDEINFVLNDTDDASEISFYMNTPWGPPLRIFETLHNKGLTVRALYFEPGMQLYGCFEDGKDFELDDGEIENVYGSMKNFFSKDALGQEFDQNFSALQYFEDDDGEDDDNKESHAA